jgi:hypothetical protein
MKTEAKVLIGLVCLTIAVFLGVAIGLPASALTLANARLKRGREPLAVAAARRRRRGGIKSLKGRKSQKMIGSLQEGAKERQSRRKPGGVRRHLLYRTGRALQFDRAPSKSRAAAARASSVIVAPASIRAISSRRASFSRIETRVATRLPRPAAALAMRK